jgi:fatty acid desaturase
MQETESVSKAITWYRSPLDPKVMKELHQRSDGKAWLQTLGYLGVFCCTGGAAIYSSLHWPIGFTLIFIFLHGMVCALHINAVHELGHGTVFKTKGLNLFFTRLISFLGWINYEMFNTSHMRHHRYTLHQPDDLEVRLPIKVIIRQMFAHGIINRGDFYRPWRDAIRVSCGRFKGEWEKKLYPEGTPERAAAIRWARWMLAGHVVIILGAGLSHLWVLPFLTTFTAGYGGWLQYLANNTQHIGLQDDVSDFRLCCRTFTTNPLLQFMYWHMNFHIEHHMYAAVPCYNLGRLHRAIKADLPACPHGLVATWREIGAILKIQETNPTYEHVAVLPAAGGYGFQKAVAVA